MRYSFLVVLALALTGSGWGAQGKKITAQKTALTSLALAANGALKVSVVPLGSNAPLGGPSQNSQLALGNVSYSGAGVSPGVTERRTQDGLVISTRFGLLLQDGGGNELRTATVSAFLLNPDGGRTYLLDGVRLTTVPHVISVTAPVGIVSAHRLEIEVLNSDNAGPIADSLGFLVTAN